VLGPRWPRRQENRGQRTTAYHEEQKAVMGAEKWHTAPFIGAREGRQIGGQALAHGLNAKHGGDRPMACSRGRQGTWERQRWGGTEMKTTPVRRSLSTCSLSTEELGHATAAANDVMWWLQRRPMATARGRA
jgi:hypothetical protein